MDNIKLNEIKQEDIIKIEKEFERAVLDVLDAVDILIKDTEYLVYLEVERTIDPYRINAELISANFLQCLELGYSSYVSIAVTDLNGKLIGNDEDGYLIDNIYIWNVYKYAFFFTRGMLTDLYDYDEKVKYIFDKTLELLKEVGIEKED
ncbi:hypothetical protein CLPU_9c00710 [Gottschalkia purinilytica]|uniref:Uncharacterized protein n=1 Tax=Gottschalkia purinilytica TaxID=1503 RepID=A0A0L0WA34_GOTPU|nr:hypothetical protein [Gottschalkia purinilytica]KNF08175.1 hypothetical protein CLPU_9c00710 [Gottschalkia purinilytica]